MIKDFLKKLLSKGSFKKKEPFVKDSEKPEFEKYYKVPENPGVCTINWPDVCVSLKKDEVYKLDSLGYLVAVSEESFYFVLEDPSNGVVNINSWILLPAKSGKSLRDLAEELRKSVNDPVLNKEPDYIPLIKTIM